MSSRGRLSQSATTWLAQDNTHGFSYGPGGSEALSQGIWVLAGAPAGGLPLGGSVSWAFGATRATAPTLLGSWPLLPPGPASSSPCSVSSAPSRKDAGDSLAPTRIFQEVSPSLDLDSIAGAESLFV